MNSEKTKVIWIGCKKHSKDKLNVTARLEWGVSKFTLLGLEFSTDLDTIPEMNYNKVLSQARKIIKSWQYRILTPLGKIAVIKTLVLSKFNHLFISIPISEKFLKKINDLIFHYLWGGKPDKISRMAICANYFDGGLKMVNIFNFEKSLKLSWIKRIANQDKTDWYKLLQISIKKPKDIFICGGEFCITFIKNTNPFWSSVFQYWKLFCHTKKASCNQDILSSSLWYNRQLSKNNLFYQDWFNKGIHTIGDVVDSEGIIHDYKVLKRKYDLNINILNYYTVKGLVNQFIARNRVGDDFEITRPQIPFHINTLLNTSKSCSKKFYLELVKAESGEPLCEIKWNDEFNYILNKDHWKVIYKICFKSLVDNSFVWFQYRILYRILGTKAYLHKLKIFESNLCGLCGDESESITHLFSECKESNELWNNVKNWLKNSISYVLDLNRIIKILGYTINDENFWPLNFLLLIVRNYIFNCSKHNRHLNIYNLQMIAKEKYLEQEAISKFNSQYEKFTKRWIVWKNIFCNINQS